MRKTTTIIISIVVLLAIAGIIYTVSQNSNRPQLKILVTDQGFEPATLEIKQGTEVEFQNIGQNSHWPASDFHPTHGIYPEFDPLKQIEPGESWKFVFGKVGTWKFHDHVSPEFKGTIKVIN